MTQGFGVGASGMIKRRECVSFVALLEKIKSKTSKKKREKNKL